MSWNLRSRKTSAPALAQRAHDRRARRGEQLVADLVEAARDRRARSTSASACSRRRDVERDDRNRGRRQRSAISSVPDELGDATHAVARRTTSSSSSTMRSGARGSRSAAVPTPTSDAPARMYCSASVAARDAADADDRQRHRAPDLPRREHADRQDRRAAHAAGAEAERRPPPLDVDHEPGNRVHDADRVRAGVGRDRAALRRCPAASATASRRSGAASPRARSATTSRSAAGSAPNSMPPAFTFGQLTLSS